MILTISTTHHPATDLGYLLHKHPDKLHTYDLSFGKVYVFYPESGKDKVTVALLLDIDSIDMVRNSKQRGGDAFVLGHYINDRPYVASSFLSVAIAKVFSSALNGKCNARPDLTEIKFPFEVSVTSIPAPRGGEQLIRKLFEPLGYTVNLNSQILDSKFPEWGLSKYYSMMLENFLTLKELLTHLYVLIPTLDNDKHYFVSQAEIDKLLQKGEGWLKNHPEREQIIRRYLVNINSLSKMALARLSEGDENGIFPDNLLASEGSDRVKETLHDRRISLVVEKLVESGAESVIDLGCGEGKLLRQLIKHKQFRTIAGMDVSYAALLNAGERLHLDEMSPKQKERIKLFQGSLTYRDKRLEGFDAAAVVEVIEHLDLNRLKAFERILFEFSKPKTIVLTTPNREYNILWEKLGQENMRHEDHRFEWDRKEFSDWTIKIGKLYNYQVEILSIGEEMKGVGAPSQMAIFKYGN